MDKSLKRGPIDQFLKRAPAGPVQDAPQPPLPEQQPPPPQNAPPQNACFHCVQFVPKANVTLQQGATHNQSL